MTVVTRLNGSRFEVEPATKHPAQFSDAILDTAATLLCSHGTPNLRVLDPFGGQGNVHALIDRVSGVRTTSVELEPEWVAVGVERYGPNSSRRSSFVGDSTRLPARWSGRYGAAFSSPCYGNRMSDSHVNTDACSQCEGSGIVWATVGKMGEPRRTPSNTSKPCPKCKGSGLSTRRSYTHDLGRKLDEHNAGAMYFWQSQYRELHIAVWREVHRVLAPGGLFLLNVKDFVRTVTDVPERQRVAYWHLRTCERIGFERIETVRLPHRGMRYGANRHRAPNELIYVLRKES